VLASGSAVLWIYRSVPVPCDAKSAAVLPLVQMVAGEVARKGNTKNNWSFSGEVDL